MASADRDQKWFFLIATAVTIISEMVLMANIPAYSGQNTRTSSDDLDQIVSVVIQMMTAFWIVLIGYLVYHNYISVKKGPLNIQVQAGKGRNFLAFALVLLAFWLVLLLANPLDGLGHQGTQKVVGPDTANSTAQNLGQSTSAMPLVLPTIVVVIALASVLAIWRFMRSADGQKMTVSGRSEHEEEKAVLDDAMRNLYAGEDPRSTIIRTYQRMCLLVRDGRLDDEPLFTPREFAERAVSQLGWGREPLEDLTLLFEEARYSDHILGEEQKNRAIASFERIREGLGRSTDA